MLPCPVTCRTLSFGDSAVCSDVSVNESYVTVVCLRLLIEKSEDSLCACTCHYDGVHLHRELVDVTHELLTSVKERNDDVDSHRKSGEREVNNAEYGHETAAYCKENVNDVSDVADDGRQDVGISVSLAAVFCKSVIELVELSLDLVLVIEDLNDLLAVHDLLNIAFRGGNSLLLSDEVLSRTCADLTCCKHHCNDSEDHDKRHPDTVVEHDDEYGNNYNTGSQDRRQSHGYKLSQCIDIVGVVAHDLAVLMSIEVSQRQRLHLVEKISSELVQELLRHVCLDL